MRTELPLLAALLVSAAFIGRILGDQPSSTSTSAGVAFREKCEMVESLEFGQKTARTLAGHVWVSAPRGVEPLKGLQIAARAVTSGKVAYEVTSAEGQFALLALPPGEYDVWTCLDGFDELRFRLILDPNSKATGIDLYVSPSEAPGRQDVVLRETM